MLTDTFPHNQHMASICSNAGNAAGGSQNSSFQDGNHLCINMVDAKVHVATRFWHYRSAQAIPGLEYPPHPPETTL
jgi:hypothetical protein